VIRLLIIIGRSPKSNFPVGSGRIFRRGLWLQTGSYQLHWKASGSHPICFRNPHIQFKSLCIRRRNRLKFILGFFHLPPLFNIHRLALYPFSPCFTRIPVQRICETFCHRPSLRKRRISLNSGLYASARDSLYVRQERKRIPIICIIIKPNCSRKFRWLHALSIAVGETVWEPDLRRGHNVVSLLYPGSVSTGKKGFSEALPPGHPNTVSAKFHPGKLLSICPTGNGWSPIYFHKSTLFLYIFMNEKLRSTLSISSLVFRKQIALEQRFFAA